MTEIRRQPPMEGAIIKRPMQGAVIQRQPMQGAVIQRQPIQGAIIKQRKWMENPGPIEGVPPGLELLVELDQINVKQLMEFSEMSGCGEGRNQYDIINKLGEQLYKIKENSEEFERICYGQCRGFIYPIRDISGQEVIRMSHETCQGCEWPYCKSGPDWGFELVIEAPPGNLVGFAREWHDGPGFRTAILDAKREVLYRMTGEDCTCIGPCCPRDLEYPITDMDGNNIANVYKRWAGTYQESFSDADNFGLTFPKDMIITHKILLLGAIFLVDKLKHEHDGKGGGGGG
ncbi:phospholipid scramblase 1-like [Saccostrea cucullata]|uniref:phospholipid scramblase 1-like n=1 Tax=Saccostrea cuccullata TaxID=36930 RepID=UPI002ED2829C